MNEFEQAKLIERQSLKILDPLLDLVAYKGRWVWNGKGRLAQELQISIGDVQLNTDSEHIIAIELKAERDWSFNFYLEAWSNRRIYRPGWMWTSNADFLFYHFLSSDDLYCIDFQALKRWFHGCDHRSRPPWCLWPHAEQGRYVQRNDTWGVLIPINEVEKAVGFDRVHPLNGARTQHCAKGNPAPMHQEPLPSIEKSALARPTGLDLDQYLGR